MVAVHDSELTRALETMPATNGTPTGPGTTGMQWWTTNWHYFVMPDSVKEALRSDGTAFTTVSDADISAGNLLDTNGQPNYPILISLACEAMRDDEIAPLTNYVAAGGYAFIGSSSFTRNTNGTSRGDFAIANAMGMHRVKSGLTNWTLDATFSRVSNHPLVAHIPPGAVTWQMPSSSEEISWPESVHVSNPPVNLLHLLWQVQPTGASVIAQGDFSPYLLVKNYGKGCFIYIGAMQPMIAHGGWSPGMYSYTIIRNAIQLAFASAQMPLPRVSPWPYPYDAAVIFRHDMEAVPEFINSIEQSARFEFTNGARGDYFFCTGELRDNMPPNGPTIASLQRAVSNYSATIGPHNGGLTNINFYLPTLATNSYDYWHWGPDEMLDSSPVGYANGQAYARASMSNSFNDIQGWLGAYTNTGSGLKLWVAPYFNATREGSYQIEEQLGIHATGEQKLGPFPHWTVSTQTPDKLYSTLTLPVSDWFVGTQISQALEDGYTTNLLHSMVDFYYNMGALINLYSHSPSDGSGPAGPLASEYVTYSLSKPHVWSANTAAIYNWWVKRSTVSVVPSYSTVGTQASLSFAISGSTVTNTSVETYLPSSAYYDLQVLTNGVVASGAAYRVIGQNLKICVGQSVTNVQALYKLPPTARNEFYQESAGASLNIGAPGVLSNDFAGTGGTNLTVAPVATSPNGTLNLNANGSFTYVPISNFTGVDTFTYQVNDALTNSATAETAIMTVPTGDMFYDNFNRATNATSLTPWVNRLGTWTITNSALTGSTVSNAYGFVYYGDTNLNWTDYTVTANVQFSTINAWGGGLGGRLDPTTGSHYAAWIYPEGSGGGPTVLKLIKFEGWTMWSFNPIASVSLPSVGTNAHNVSLTFQSNRITVQYDGATVISVFDGNHDSVLPYTNGGVIADLFNAGTPYTLSIANISVTPLAPPTNFNINYANNSAVLNWTSVANQLYRIQYKNALTDTNWNSLVPDILASGVSTSSTNTTLSSATQFYRVMLVP